MGKLGDLWQCQDCLWTTRYKTRLWEHIEAKHVKSGGYSCPLCNKFCPSKNAWHLHKSRYHKGCWNKRLEMQFLAELVFSLGALWEEIQRRIFPLSDLEPGNSRFGCTDCSHTSRDKHAMSLHIESKHVKSSGYTCPICSKFCPSRNAWHLHKSRYHKGLWFQTLIFCCGQRCTRIQKEWTVAQTVISSPRYPLMCGITLSQSM